jgi:hypothetical protein
MKAMMSYLFLILALTPIQSIAQEVTLNTIYVGTQGEAMVMLSPIGMTNATQPTPPTKSSENT